jgi:hypothetical protein
MQQYNVVPYKKQFAIKETKTGYVLWLNDDRTEAFKLCKRLNRGFGFAGETPSFFIRKKEQVC